jgi:hypothetical protein
MAKKESPSMAAFRDRLRNQVTTAHIKEEVEVVAPPIPSPDTKVEKPPKSTAKPVESNSVVAAPKANKRRRSPWTDPYPDVEAHQATIYQTDEDPMLIKQLRLKLKFSKDWHVYKYALDKLAKEEKLK